MSGDPVPRLGQRWAETYRGLDGVYDELLAADQTIRPHWAGIVAALESEEADALQTRWEAAQREIASNGIAFHPTRADSDAQRPWVLDAIPLVLSGPEWQTVAAGVEQRARLLNAILDDVYGDQRLVRDRLVPPEILFNHPRYFPTLMGAHGPSRHRLHLYAADLARSPDGAWWVTNDHTRAPLGLGFLLENRLVTSRLVAGIFDESRVQRLAPFFAAYRAELLRLSVQHRDEPRIVLWSQGPASQGYFEDAYLARYLGFSLAEGGDLAVRGNRVVLKTLRGLLPVDVLVRRLDDHRCDGLELGPDAGSGISGLAEVARAGNVAVTSPLGSSLAESPIWAPFLPNLCKRLLGEELRVPNVATWWCGDPTALEYVVAHLDTLIVRGAYDDSDTAPKMPHALSKSDRAALLARIKAKPQAFVAQETVNRSTAPVWNNGHVEAWRVGLRAYAAAAHDEFTVLQGGLARVSPRPDAIEFTAGDGMRTQDVWILADHDVDHMSLLPPAGRKAELRRGGSDLPSRVADNLYWLGRNMERAEHLVRIERVAFRMVSGEFDDRPVSKMLLRLARGTESNEKDTAPQPMPPAEIRRLVDSIVTGPSELGNLRDAIGNSVRLISSVRDRVAIAMWRSVQRTRELADRLEFSRARGVSAALEVLDSLLSELNAFSGLAAESMTRTEGWRFLDLGRRLERALQLSSLLRCSLTVPIDDEQAVMEALLYVGDSVMTYRVRYMANVQPSPLLDLLLTDDTNPRSVAYQLSAVNQHIGWLPRATQVGLRGPDQRLALSMLNSVQLADVHRLSQVGRHGRRERLSKLLMRIENQIPKLSDIVSGQYLVHAGLPRHFASSAEGVQ